MDEIVIVADLGNVKVFKIMRDPLGLKSPTIELIRNCVFIEPHAKSSDKFSDAAGRFYLGKGKKGTAAGFGEPHTVKLEAEKRLIKQFAEDMNALIAEERCERWHLAADRSINSQIVKKLDPSVKARLKKNITANLTKTAKSKILEHFV